MSPEDKIRKADDAFYEVFHQFRFYHYLNPVNHSEERETFLNRWDFDKAYNPRFEYNALPDSLPQWKKRLKSLEFGITPLEICFENACKELITTLEVAEARGTPEITQKSAQLFGVPNASLVKEAEAMIKESATKSREPAQEIGIKALAKQIRDRLREARIDGWDVVEDPLNITLAEADWTQRKIHLSAGMVVVGDLIDRLLHHIIEVHVYRALNGERQPYKAFVVGLDQSAETEEGLAVELEERVGLLTPPVRRRYAGRTVAVNLSGQKSFFDIFRRLVEFFGPDEAYTLAQRSKRGLTDTAQPGGFSRDHIYLQGKKRLKNLTAPELHLLYTGKIAVHHIPLVKEMISKHQLVEAAFLPAALRER